MLLVEHLLKWQLQYQNVFNYLILLLSKVFDYLLRTIQMMLLREKFLVQLQKQQNYKYNNKLEMNNKMDIKDNELQNKVQTYVYTRILVQQPNNVDANCSNVKQCIVHFTIKFVIS